MKKRKYIYMKKIKIQNYKIVQLQNSYFRWQRWCFIDISTSSIEPTFDCDKRRFWRDELVAHAELDHFALDGASRRRHRLEVPRRRLVLAGATNRSAPPAKEAASLRALARRHRREAVVQVRLAVLQVANQRARRKHVHSATDRRCLMNRNLELKRT